MKRILLAVIFFLTVGMAQAKEVLISFDASAVLEMWQDSLDFAKENHVKYTYFVSAPYFVIRSQVNAHGSYWAEREIGTPYVKVREDSDYPGVIKRLDYVLRAVNEHHEIGSHLCGHYDGTKWSEEKWEKEFTFFDWAMSHGQGGLDMRSFIKSIRAPYLATNEAYFKVLKAHGYEVDSSLSCGRSLAPPFTRGMDFEIPIRAIEVNFQNNQMQTPVIPFDCNFALIKIPFAKPHDNQLLADVFFESLCFDYLNNPNPTQICLHGIRHGMDPFYEAMKRFVLWAKDKKPQYMTYHEYYEEKHGATRTR